MGTVFENERKDWGLWSAEYLWGVERSPLSHGNGTGSYDWGRCDGPHEKAPSVVPPVGWQWAEPWRSDDWQYARVWGLHFYDEDFFTATVRRRVWRRRCVFRPDVFDKWTANTVSLGQWMGSSDTGTPGGDCDRAAAILEELHEKNASLADVDVPEELCCPLTMEPMLEPVVTADGHTYERAAIEAWLEQHDTSPLTNKHLEHRQLIPNLLVRSQL